MKNLFLSAVLLLFAVGLNAQSNLAVENQYPGNEKALKVYQKALEKQTSEKTSALRTTWLANRPCDNWFLSLEGGVSMFVGENFSFDDFPANVKPLVGLSFGKWFSPVWGMRVGVNSAHAHAYGRTANGTWRGPDRLWHNGTNAGAAYIGTDADGNSMEHFAWATATLDGMLNLKNFFMRYNPKGFFNPVLYLGMGYGHTFGHSFDPYGIAKDGARTVSNLVLKSGLQLNFRLGDPVNLYLDIQGIVVPESFDGNIGAKFMEGMANASLGLTFNFNFSKFIKAPLYDQNEIDALNKEINDLRNRPVPVCPPAVVCPPAPECPPAAVQEVVLAPVFFTIDSSVVRENQMINVATAAEYLKSHPDAKIELRSYADRKTAYPKYNQALSERRSAAVAKVLVEKFGIAKSRIIEKAFGDKVQPFAENDLNRVTMFIK